MVHVQQMHSHFAPESRAQMVHNIPNVTHIKSDCVSSQSVVFSIDSYLNSRTNSEQPVQNETNLFAVSMAITSLISCVYKATVIRSMFVRVHRKCRKIKEMREEKKVIKLERKCVYVAHTFLPFKTPTTKDERQKRNTAQTQFYLHGMESTVLRRN